MKKRLGTGGDPLRTYQEVIVGRPGWVALVYFEWCAWLSPVPGAVGLLLRKLFWPRLFAACGRGVVFGVNVVCASPVASAWASGWSSATAASSTVAATSGPNPSWSVTMPCSPTT